MAYTSCAASIAANISRDCAHPLVGGYTGRGVLIAWKDAPTFTQDASNARIIESITLGSGVKVAVIDNVWANAFDGSNKASNGDNGIVNFTKQFAFRVPLRGAATAQDIIEPLANAPLGYIAVLEKNDKVGDGSYEVVGFEQGLKATADGLTQSESENGGAWSVTMQCTENFAEYVLFDTNYTTTKAAFEALIANAF